MKKNWELQCQTEWFVSNFQYMKFRNHIFLYLLDYLNWNQLFFQVRNCLNINVRSYLFNKISQNFIFQFQNSILYISYLHRLSVSWQKKIKFFVLFIFQEKSLVYQEDIKIRYFDGVMRLNCHSITFFFVFLRKTAVFYVQNHILKVYTYFVSFWCFC